MLYSALRLQRQRNSSKIRINPCFDWLFRDALAPQYKIQNIEIAKINCIFKSNTIIFVGNNIDSMDRLFSQFKISIQPGVYIKDPESSELGKKILSEGIILIDELGFDEFTFKKLGQKIGSNESSIYRYFENKHKFLIYLSSWYWTWMEYQLVLETHSIAKPTDKLMKAIEVSTRPIKIDGKFIHMNEVVLHRIMISENAKSFLTKEVDKENSEGYFSAYKRYISRLKEMIVEVDGSYRYSASLASSVVEIAMHQYFLTDHFPSITNCTQAQPASEFVRDTVSRVLNINEDGK